MGVAKAPRGLIGSPSVPGSEQMSEWDERARSRFLLHLYFSCLCLFACLPTGLTGHLRFVAARPRHRTSHAQTDTRPAGGGPIVSPYGAS